MKYVELGGLQDTATYKEVGWGCGPLLRNRTILPHPLEVMPGEKIRVYEDGTCRVISRRKKKEPKCED